MALRSVKNRPINAVEVISQQDDSVDMEKSDWEEYRKTGDKSKLVFNPGMQPTIFLCNFALKGKEAARIKNEMIGGQDDEGKPKITLGNWGFQVAKLTLKEIKNPEDVPDAEKLVYKKDERGYAHDDVLGELDTLGVIDDIFAMYTNLAMSGARKNAKN